MTRLLVLVLAGLAAAAVAFRPTGGVQIVVLDDQQRVDVSIDGALFTAYVYHDSIATLKKPVLYPIRTAGGQDITRGYPFEPRAGERVDHPHHIGHWLNYGDVNGYDFWNNSDAVPEERRPRMGAIRHRAIIQALGGDEHGVLDVEADWLTPTNTRLLQERTRFIFSGDDSMRVIDRITTLTALDQDVVFTDNKEGMIALRVTRALEHPEGKPVLLTDAAGKPRPEAVLDDTGVSGEYLSSEGVRGVDVWGTRGEWMMLIGELAGEPVTVALIDHPRNPGYPTYWHARGYGLFAANPLGQKALSGGKEALNFALKASESVTFRYRIVVLSDPADAEKSVRQLAATFADTP
ncbi:MAG: PmoA family protein [Rhodothermales bacterium]|nr:PmoA family protein [Rhodothermales bacterium]